VLLDFDFLQAKLEFTDAGALIADLRLFAQGGRFASCAISDPAFSACSGSRPPPNGDVQLLDRLFKSGQASRLGNPRRSVCQAEFKMVAGNRTVCSRRRVNYLIIVGAGHLVGDDGVVAQLRRASYSVQQL